VAPGSFGILLSVALLVGTLGGAWFGALFIQFVPDLPESISKSAPAAIYAILLIAAGLFAPGGIAGLIRAARRRA
jgi:branched-chain amino acid transport system permease protein